MYVRSSSDKRYVHSQDERLEQAVEQSWSSTFKGSMADKLRCPGEVSLPHGAMDSAPSEEMAEERILERIRSDTEVIQPQTAEVGHAEGEWRIETTGNRIEQDKVRSIRRREKEAGCHFDRVGQEAEIELMEYWTASHLVDENGGRGEDERDAEEVDRDVDRVGVVRGVEADL